MKTGAKGHIIAHRLDGAEDVTMATTEAAKAAKQRYKAKVRKLYIEFYPTEAELLEHIEKQPAKQTYIKQLIREDLERKRRTEQ